MLGIAGNIVLHLAILTLLVAAVLSIKKQFALAKKLFLLHGLALATTLGILYYLIFSHQFQYFYVWDHTATDMPSLFLVSSMWEGQEGSFLLWIVFNFLIGFLIFRNLQHKNSFGFLIFTVIQCFLLFMISGVSIGNIRIGASPFRLLAQEFPDDPVFLQDPNFIPSEGSGLNPLLQNSWMAIHPPVIFLSFAIAVIPFILYSNGLRNNNFQETIKKTIPWSLATTLLLLTGIVMGAYWAYETLNFGGYWSWDPVENAIYMPWLLSVAALHMQLVALKKKSGYKTAFYFTMATYCMVIYSTFLTRSGILGDSSVHAFTDLGTSPILIVFLLATIGFTIFLPVLHKKNLSSKNIFDGDWNRATFMTISAILILLAALQVFATTSIPVFNSLALIIGVDLNLTAPLDPIPYYNLAQGAITTLLLIISALAIKSTWHKKLTLDNTLVIVLPLCVIIGLIGYKFLDLPIIYALFMGSLSFVIIVNAIDWYLAAKTHVSFHHLTHIGFYILLAGILVSGTNEHATTLNSTLAPDQENLFLARNKPSVAENGHTFTYEGKFRKTIDGELIDTDLLAETSKEDTYLHLAEDKPSELVTIKDDHFYYQIVLNDGQVVSTHHPTILKSPKGDIIVHPEITHKAAYDYFMHLTNFSSLDPSTLSWKNDTTIVMHIGETMTYGSHSLTFNAISNEAPANGTPIEDEDLSLRAKITVDNEITLAPKFIIKNDLAYMIPSYNARTGLNLKLKDIDVESGAYTFKLGKSGLDWLTLKVIKKPFISLIWIGAIIMFIGIFLTLLAKSSLGIKAVIKKAKLNTPGTSKWQPLPHKIEWLNKIEEK